MSAKSGFEKETGASRVVETGATPRLQPDGLLPYDPMFRSAVSNGFLSAQEAARRGNRAHYARRLASKHGLAMAQALMVADNRMRLLDAMRRNRARLRMPPPRPRMKRRDQVAVLGVGLALVGLFLLQGFSMWRAQVARTDELRSITRLEQVRHAASPAERSETADPTESAGTTAGWADVLADATGRVTRITGPSPQSVLLAFCESPDTPGIREPVGIVDQPQPFPGRKLGLFRDSGELGALHSIRIRRDSRSRRWVTGDGKLPIPTALVQ